jgi:chemosensory pili system protein ChpA (sensor histidine kinase/response regulator)
VVIILDLISLLRAERAGSRMRADTAISETQQVLVSGGEKRSGENNKKIVTRAFVVDDSITVRKVVQRLLGRCGMQVSVAKDGLEAMMLLREVRPDIALIDVEMPRMDGLELVAWMRNQPHLRAVPVIMITSRVGEKHRQRAEALGVTHYIGKPFQEQVLLETIHTLLGLSMQS